MTPVKCKSPYTSAGNNLELPNLSGALLSKYGWIVGEGIFSESVDTGRKDSPGLRKISSCA